MNCIFPSKWAKAWLPVVLRKATRCISVETNCYHWRDFCPDQKLPEVSQKNQEAVVGAEETVVEAVEDLVAAVEAFNEVEQEAEAEVRPEEEADLVVVEAEVVAEDLVEAEDLVGAEDLVVAEDVEVVEGSDVEVEGGDHSCELVHCCIIYSCFILSSPCTVTSRVMDSEGEPECMVHDCPRGNAKRLSFAF